MASRDECQSYHPRTSEATAANMSSIDRHSSKSMVKMTTRPLLSAWMDGPCFREGGVICSRDVLETV
jgi:hypothetical protein